MFNTAVTGSQNTGTLSVEGELTLPNSPALKAAIQDVLKRFKEIIIRIGDIEQVDFSCFQVFCAAHKSAMNLEKTITVVPPEKDPSRSLFSQQLELSGLWTKDGENEDGHYTGIRGFLLREDI